MFFSSKIKNYSIFSATSSAAKKQASTSGLSTGNYNPLSYVKAAISFYDAQKKGYDPYQMKEYAEESGYNPYFTTELTQDDIITYAEENDENDVFYDAACEEFDDDDTTDLPGKETRLSTLINTAACSFAWGTVAAIHGLRSQERRIKYLLTDALKTKKKLTPPAASKKKPTMRGFGVDFGTPLVERNPSIQQKFDKADQLIREMRQTFKEQKNLQIAIDEAFWGFVNYDYLNFKTEVLLIKKILN